MRAAAATAVGVLALLSGCSGDGNPVEPAAGTVTTSGTGEDSGWGWEPEPTASSTTGAPPVEEIQRILDEARFTEKQVGLPVNEDYQRESGLDTPTASFCGDQGDPADDKRIARSQRWWANRAWYDGESGALTVGVEVVAYRPGGVADTMAVFAGVPERCPSVSYESGSSATIEPGTVPSGMPAGTVALRDRWTYPDGRQAPGAMVAIPAGDVIGFLYIRGDRTAVDERVAELARQLANSVVAAAAAVGELG